MRKRKNEFIKFLVDIQNKIEKLEEKVNKLNEHEEFQKIKDAFYKIEKLNIDYKQKKNEWEKIALDFNEKKLSEGDTYNITINTHEYENSPEELLEKFIKGFKELGNKY